MRRAIAIDFDGCLCENRWPEIGEPNRRIIGEAISAKKSGAALILWTCRVGKALEKAVQFCEEFGLRFDAVNENLPERITAYGNDCRKVNADEYWDDASVLMPSRIAWDDQMRSIALPFKVGDYVYRIHATKLETPVYLGGSILYQKKNVVSISHLQVSEIRGRCDSGGRSFSFKLYGEENNEFSSFEEDDIGTWAFHSLEEAEAARNRMQEELDRQDEMRVKRRAEHGAFL